MLFKLFRSKFKNDELRSCSVSTGGGMLGGYHNAELRRTKEGGAVLTVLKKEMHSDREVKTVYSADPNELDRVAEMTEKYDLYAASKRPMGDMVVLDGDTTSLSFTFTGGHYYVSEEQDMTKKMSEGFRKVRDHLYSLAAGEGIVTVEPQTAMLYLKSGYTLRFIVEDEFDGRLDSILTTEREVSRFGDCGITMCTGEKVDTSGAAPVKTAPAACIIYDEATMSIVILYKKHTFEGNIYILARLDHDGSLADPLIEQMTGEYKLFLN